jgi:predicted GNAT family N-acyltransferase
MSDSLQFNVRRADWVRDQVPLKALRREVFVVEQKVPEDEEWDDMDATNAHVLAVASDGTPIGTGRLLLGEHIGRIGRMAVRKSWRGRGVGSALLCELLELVLEHGYEAACLHAQTHALEFYRKHGFSPVGAEFLEAGIPHFEMRKVLTQQA